MRVKNERSDWCPVVCRVMDEVTKDVRQGIVKEFLYSDGLALFGESWKKWRRGISSGRRWKKER